MDSVSVSAPCRAVRVEIGIVLFGAVGGPAQGADAKLLHKEQVYCLAHFIAAGKECYWPRRAEIKYVQRHKAFIDAAVDTIVVARDAAGEL